MNLRNILKLVSYDLYIPESYSYSISHNIRLLSLLDYISPYKFLCMYFNDKDLGVEFLSYLSGEFIFLEKEYDDIVLESLINPLIDYSDLIYFIPSDSIHPSLLSLPWIYENIIASKDIKSSSKYIEVKIKGIPEVEIFFQESRNNTFCSFSNLQLPYEDIQLILNLNTKEV